MENSTFGERIASLRAEREETQQELADALDVRRETVKFWESGDRQIKAADIVKLAKHFEVSADYILGLSEAMYADLDVQAVSQSTGLSEASLNTLARIKRNPNLVKMLNLLLSTSSNSASFRDAVNYSTIALDSTSKLDEKLANFQRGGVEPDWIAWRHLFTEARWFRYDAIECFTRLVDDITDYQRVKHIWECIAKIHEIPIENPIAPH